MGTWNVLILGDDDRVPVLSRSLKDWGWTQWLFERSRAWDLVRLWWDPITTTGQWSGPPEVKLRGVGVGISNQMSERLRQVTQVDERIFHIRLEQNMGS